MDSHEPAIDRHYAVDGLLDRIEAALDHAGKGGSRLTSRDLSPVDAFHVRGRRATAELAELAGISAGLRILDIGSGLGGAARYLAEECDCLVTGLDATPAFTEVATALSARVGLEDRTRFETGRATALPFAAGSFDVVWCEAVQMNIADKATFAKEVARVLVPGGRFACHEILGVEGREPLYPVPWSEGPELSFVVTAAGFRSALEGTGFRADAWRNTTDVTVAWYEKVASRLAPGPPPLGLHLVMGDSTMPKLHNLGRALREGLLEAWQGVFSIA